MIRKFLLYFKTKRNFRLINAQIQLFKYLPTHVRYKLNFGTLKADLSVSICMYMCFILSTIKSKDPRVFAIK